MAYRRILVPLDGSKLSEQALGQLAQIAAPGAAIQVLSVKGEDAAAEVNALSRSVNAGHDAALSWPPIAGVKDPHAPDAREQYLHHVKEWLEAAEYEVRTSIREGNIVDAILEAAKANDAIVIATYQKPAATSRVTGSIVEALLQRAPCPVLVVPGQHGG
jgi:nucleotide-binding universal stress UspA family protein